MEVEYIKDKHHFCCKFCGITRSKKSLIRVHMLLQHKDEVVDVPTTKMSLSRKCEECGASFKKPAHLRQHISTHSEERPFLCPVSDCHRSFKRKDHLTRHSHVHQGKLFPCPVEDCDHKFSSKCNVPRHVKNFHKGKTRVKQGPYTCGKNECGKVFQYLSKLKKHDRLHNCTQKVCCKCLKHFSDVKCLRAHFMSCHMFTVCDVCGNRVPTRNLRRHQQRHEGWQLGNERVICDFDGCGLSFSRASNLRQHLRSVHLHLKPFVCSVPGCGKRFSYKHVRDNHEKSGAHIIVVGDFRESDEIFRSRPRGGRKRENVTVDSLFRKRVVPPSTESALDNGIDYLRWLLGSED